MPFFFRTLAAVAAALLAQNAQSQSVIYNNTSGYNGNLNFDNAEAGNEVVLAGSASSDYITQFQVQFDLINSGASPLAGAPTGNEEVEVNFYKNNGAQVSGYDSPGTLLWSSGFSSMSTIGLSTFSEGQTLTYNPDVVVPDDFTWTLVFENVPDGESAGMGLFSEPAGPSVGGNYSDAWVYTAASGWQLYVASPGNPSLQFGAVLEGVPELGTVALGVLGAGAFLAWRRRTDFLGKNCIR